MPKMTLPPGKTDRDYVLGLLRDTGILVVFGSGFGTDAADGFFRVVFLAPLAELDAIYDAMAAYRFV
jgi:aspartate/methionine/tyrosine aminotransferase